MKTRLWFIVALCLLPAIPRNGFAVEAADSLGFTCPAKPTKLTLRQHYKAYSDALIYMLDEETGLDDSVKLTPVRMSMSKEKVKKSLSTVHQTTGDFGHYGKTPQGTLQKVCLYPIAMEFEAEGIDRVSKKKVRKKVTRDILVPAIAEPKILT